MCGMRARASQTAGAARTRQAQERSCYVRGRKGGVKDAMGAAAATGESVAPGGTILLCAARPSGMNVSATRRVTTISSHCQ
jgi:hypothetical protein